MYMYNICLDETVAMVNRLLGQYVGTHNFHNFTSGNKFEQMSSNRYIMSFEVSDNSFVVTVVLQPEYMGLSTLGLSIAA